MAMQSQMLVQGGIGDIFNLMSATGEMKRSHEQGDSAPVSIAKGIGNFAWSEFYYGGVGRIANELKLSQIGGFIGSAPGNLVGLVGKGLTKGGLKVPGAVVGAAGGGMRLAGSFIGSAAPMMIMSMLPQAGGMLANKWENNAKVMTKAYKQRGKLGSGYFEMSQAGYTMRQRSLNAIRQNGLNTQTALGNEARMYFRGVGTDD